jgi:PhnB protein
MKSIEPRTVLSTFLFKGQANEALSLYTKAFGAKVITKALYSDADPKDLQYKEEEKDFIFSAKISIGGISFLIADDSTNVLKLNEDLQGRLPGTALCILYEKAEEVKAAFDIMSEGATILVPIQSYTYCAAYVLFVDKFGVRWEIMTDEWN